MKTFGSMPLQWRMPFLWPSGDNGGYVGIYTTGQLGFAPPSRESTLVLALILTWCRDQDGVACAPSRLFHFVQEQVIPLEPSIAPTMLGDGRVKGSFSEGLHLAGLTFCLPILRWSKASAAKHLRQIGQSTRLMERECGIAFSYE